MTFNLSANDIAKSITKNRATSRPKYTQNPEKRLGTVSAVTVGGKVSVILDGESDAAAYACAGNYYPIVSDRVILEKIGNTWVVMTSISVTLRPKIQTGDCSVSVTAPATGGSGAVVVFPIPFTTIPKVVINFNSGAGATAGASMRAINISATQFTPFATGPASATYTATGNWIAVASNNPF